MAKSTDTFLPHILLSNTVVTESYTSDASRSKPLRIPARNRKGHANQLINQLESATKRETEIVQEQKAFGNNVVNGIYLAFQSEPHFDLKAMSLEYQRSGIELCSTKTTQDNKVVAVVFVPEGKLEFFLRRLLQYRDEETTPRSKTGVPKPKNKALFRNGQKWVTLARQNRPSLEMTSPEFIAFPKLF